jgi:hypothetical protein
MTLNIKFGALRSAPSIIAYKLCVVWHHYQKISSQQGCSQARVTPNAFLPCFFNSDLKHKLQAYIISFLTSDWVEG